LKFGMRTPLFVANWKMHKTIALAIAFVREFGVLAKDLTGVEVVIAPPFTALAAASDAARHLPIGIAAQDLYFEVEGAFTGEVSAAMIQDAGATHVIVGHSERRRLFGETDALVNSKLRAALAAELTPIVCIGETLMERERGEMLSVLDRQIRAGLTDVSPEQVASIVIAYEPVWAIGTGRNATPAEADEAHTHIRARLREWSGAPAADRCRVLYGGSVNADNIEELAALADVDGALVGGASLDVRRFYDVITRGRRARPAEL
jgi:triosephosphate isomerase (TIM)